MPVICLEEENWTPIFDSLKDIIMQKFKLPFVPGVKIDFPVQYENKAFGAGFWIVSIIFGLMITLSLIGAVYSLC